MSDPRQDGLKTSIILPTYTERENIVDLIEAIRSRLDPQGFLYEVVVVDDDSPDGTAEVVHERYGDAPWVKLYVRTGERGLATAIRHGIEHSDGDIIVVMDTDFNHDPAMIPQMIKFLEFYDLIIGSRFVMGGGMADQFRYFSSFLYSNLFIRTLFRTQIQDNLSGFFSIYRDKLHQLGDFDRIFYGYGDYFIRLLILAWHHRFRMLEVPVFYNIRRHGQSKTGFLRIFVDYTLAVLKLRLLGLR